jgi:plasmid stability protein
MKTIQIRNVPEHLYRALEARAAQHGSTLSDYILAALPRLADRPDRPTPEQVMQRIRHRTHVGGPSAADLIRAERESR